MQQKIERPKSLSQAVTARLRREIVSGEFDLGQALSESKIAARYDVSRTPVREAFTALEHEGLVRTEPQSGTFVFTMDREQFAKMSETRSILETAALRLAYERSPDDLVKRWKRIVAGMKTALQEEDAKRYSQLDGDFHETLFDLAGNPFLSGALQSFSAKMAAVRNRLGAQPEHMRKSLKEHVELARLVEKKEPDRAVALLERHIRNKGESFWSATETARRSRWEKISQLAE